MKPDQNLVDTSAATTCRLNVVSLEMKRYAVLDQNELRKERLQFLVERRPEVEFVLPDAAIMEMCKSQSWDGVLRQSLALLSQCPQRVHTAIGMGEAFRQEVQSKKSIAG